MSTEDWSWKKFFNGFISGKRYGKDIAIAFRVSCLIVLIYFTVMGIFWVKNQFVSKRQETPTVINSSGAPVDNSKKSSIVNLLHLGSQDN